MMHYHKIVHDDLSSDSIRYRYIIQTFAGSSFKLFEIHSILVLNDEVAKSH